jgi:endonuclease YncB( thermonuclease family)
VNTSSDPSTITSLDVTAYLWACGIRVRARRRRPARLERGERQSISFDDDDDDDDDDGVAACIEATFDSFTKTALSQGLAEVAAKGTTPVIVVPLPRADRTSILPPRASSRSAMPCSPVP